MNVACEALIGESFLDVALAHHIDLQHNCGGVCACSTCHVKVKQGMDLLPEMEDDEADQLDEAEGLALDSRLGANVKFRRIWITSSKFHNLIQQSQNYFTKVHINLNEGANGISPFLLFGPMPLAPTI